MQIEHLIQLGLKCSKPIIVSLAIQVGQKPREDIKAASLAVEHPGKIRTMNTSLIRSLLKNGLVSAPAGLEGKIGENRLITILRFTLDIMFNFHSLFTAHCFATIICAISTLCCAEPMARRPRTMPRMANSATSQPGPPEFKTITIMNPSNSEMSVKPTCSMVACF